MRTVAGLAVAAILGLTIVWFMRDRSNPASSSDGVRVSAGAAAPPNSAPPDAVTQGPSPIPPTSRPPSPVADVADGTHDDIAPPEVRLDEIIDRKVRTEPRDAAWAGPAERALQSQVGNIPYVDRASIRSKCASTVCVLQLDLQPALSETNANFAITQLRTMDLSRDARTSGLMGQAAAYTSKNGRPRITTYYERP